MLPSWSSPPVSRSNIFDPVPEIEKEARLCRRAAHELVEVERLIASRLASELRISAASLADSAGARDR
ncbi:MAG TPA: hypothetical protein VFP84_08820 [Kofleriaceae bacterium]|nr:hypothetical protein [Kofleriaceae bacterium]